MVLITPDGKKFSEPCSLLDIMSSSSILQQRAMQFRQKTTKTFDDTKQSVYLYQASYGVINLSDDSEPEWIGSDDATSCLNVIFHDKSKAFICHLDFPERLTHLQKILESYFHKGKKKQNVVTAFIVGGFVGYSSLASELLSSLSTSKLLTFNLSLLFTDRWNTIERDKVYYPIFLGVAFNTQQKAIYPAKFALPARNPLGPYRLAIFYLCSQLFPAYEGCSMEIPLVDLEKLANFLDPGDSEEVKNSSTTPEQEPETYFLEFQALKNLACSRSLKERPNSVARFEFSKKQGWKPQDAETIAFIERNPLLEHKNTENITSTPTLS